MKSAALECEHGRFERHLDSVRGRICNPEIITLTKATEVQARKEEMKRAGRPRQTWFDKWRWVGPWNYIEEARHGENAPNQE